MIEQGVNGFCCILFHDKGAVYTLPAVPFDGIEEVVRADYTKWLQLAKEYTKAQSLLSSMMALLEE